MREELFGVCIHPREITFHTSKERTRWLAQRYNKLEAEALRNGGSSSAGGGACEGSGSSFSGGTFYNNGGIDTIPTEAPAEGATLIPVELTRYKPGFSVHVLGQFETWRKFYNFTKETRMPSCNPFTNPIPARRRGGPYSRDTHAFLDVQSPHLRTF